MKKRLQKKHSYTAMKYLLLMGYKHTDFAQEDSNELEDENIFRGTWCYWWNDSYEYQEWDCVSAYAKLANLLYNKYNIHDYDDGYKCIHKIDISSPKKLFAYAKKYVNFLADKRRGYKEEYGYK